MDFIEFQFKCVTTGFYKICADMNLYGSYLPKSVSVLY